MTNELDVNGVVIDKDTGRIISLPDELNYNKPHELIYYELTRELISRLDNCATPDMLEQMFIHQDALQQNMGTIDMAHQSPVLMQHYIDRMVHGVHEEAVELLRETNSKSTIMPFGWKHTKADFTKYRTEVIDLMTFVLNLWLVVDGTPDEFYQEFMRKHHINEQRHRDGGHYE